jgi:hypothetical protein
MSANGMKMWKGNENTTTLPFRNLYQERKAQMNTVVMEHFNSILFQKSGSANRINQEPINQCTYLKYWIIQEVEPGHS